MSAPLPPSQFESPGGDRQRQLDSIERMLALPVKQKPWFLSIIESLRDLSADKNQPPLQVTFKPMTEEELLRADGVALRGVAEMQQEPGFFSSLFGNLKSLFGSDTGAPLQVTARPLTKEELAQTAFGEMDRNEKPFFVGLIGNIKDVLFPEKLPPLQVTSKPVQVRELFGRDEYKGRSQAVSMAVHIGVVVLAFGIGTNATVQKAVKNSITVFTPTDIDPYVPTMQVKKQAMGGGGGGGDRSPLPASKGKLPRASLKQFTPPMAVVNNPNPRLIMEPTIIAPPDINLPQVNLSQYGDPLAKIGPPSNGPGSGGGIGSGSGGGVGSGRGGGFGPGEGGGAGGGAFRIGGGVSPPTVIFKKEPEYSEEARKAKYQGTVLLAIVVDVDGTTRNIRVIRPLGMGLDEKAIEAVQQWRFKPGYKDGRPVPVMANVEVNFRLL